MEHISPVDTRFQEICYAYDCVVVVVAIMINSGFWCNVWWGELLIWRRTDFACHCRRARLKHRQSFGMCHSCPPAIADRSVDCWTAPAVSDCWARRAEPDGTFLRRPAVSRLFFSAWHIFFAIPQGSKLNDR